MKVRQISPSLLLTIVSLVMAGCKSAAPLSESPGKAPEIVSVARIWDLGEHNAFTDLIRFKDKWFCTFRESQSHVAGGGKIRVLTSTDGTQWMSAALLSETGVDLRDPKFSITPDQRLMLVLGGTFLEGGFKSMQPRVAFSKDGSSWSMPQRILSQNDWLWRVTWHNGRCYGMPYTVPPQPQEGSTTEWSVRLVESEDGLHFRTLTEFKIPNRPNEATIRFLKNGNAVALVRREAGDKSAWIGVSSEPYKDWHWNSAGLFIGGPNFTVLPDESMIAGGRQNNPAPVGPRTFIGRMNLNGVIPQLTLPSGGDCSYPGLVWHQGLLWVSYYSSHEGRTSIYLAKVRL
jgi:hypothetical protein